MTLVVILLFLGSPGRNREFDLIIHMGSFQLQIFYVSMKYIQLYTYYTEYMKLNTIMRFNN